jgi:signal transduction histidine kinase
MNLVANAIKYSPEGSQVLIAYQRIHNTHILKVADKGIGIPKKDLHKVLRGYYRSKNAIKIQSTGTGLGLYVTKLITEQHHGKLKLTSIEGKGTVISVELPAKIKA